MATSQWWPSYHQAPSTSAVRFGAVLGAFAGGLRTTESDINAPCGAGNALTLKVRCTVAPGGSATRRVQLSINGSASTTLDVTITGTSTTGTATGTVAIAAGDLLSIKHTPGSTPAASDIEVSIEFMPTTANYYCYPGAFVSTSTITLFAGLLFGYADAATSATTHHESILPYAGTLRQVYFALDSTPTSPGTWTLNVQDNDSTIRSIAISNGSTAGNLTGLSDALTAGHTFRGQFVPASSPGGRRAKWCLVIESTTSGQFAWCGSDTTTESNATNYLGFGGIGGLDATTESNIQLTAPATLSIVSLYQQIATSPGSGATRTYQTRVGGSNGNLTCSISGTSAKTANDTSHSDSLSAGNLINIISTVASSPASTVGSWAIALSPSVAAAGTGSAAFPHFSVQGTGAQNFAATGAVSFAPFSAQGTGNEKPVGTGAATFPKFSVQGSGQQNIMATGSVAFPPFTAQGSGANVFLVTGTGAAAFPHITIAGVGFELPLGVGAITFPAFLSSSPDARAHGGKGGGQHFIGHSRDIIFPRFMVQGSGSKTVTNIGAITFPRFALQGSGIRNTNGIGAMAFPAFLTAGGQGAQNPAGSGAVSFPAFLVQGSSTLGIGLIAFPSFRSEGYSESPIGVGIGAITFPAFRVQGKQVFVSPIIILTKTGPRLGTAYIHSPWWPRQRIATLTSWHNGDYSDVATSRLGTKDTSQAAGHISNKDPALLHNSDVIRKGNLLVIETPNANPYVGILLKASEDDSTGEIELSSIGYEALLDGRLVSQTLNFKKPISSGAVDAYLLDEANARFHTGIMRPPFHEITEIIEDLAVGGQSVMEAANENAGRSKAEWWFEYRVSPQAIEITRRFGFMQGYDLSARKHFYQGTHFTAVFTEDVTANKVSQSVYGDFGADMPDRNSVTSVAAFGPQQIGISSAKLIQASIPASRRIGVSPGLYTERAAFEVRTGTTSELAHRAAVLHEKSVDAERTFNAVFYDNVDWRDVAAGNIVTLWGTWFGKTGKHVVRIIGAQPDPEQGVNPCVCWEPVL